ncbi:MAG: SCO1664 family protein [Actinomycetes bacterium]
MSGSPDDRQVPPADDADVEEADWVEVEWLDHPAGDEFDEDLCEDDDETVVFTYDATVRPGDASMVELLRTGTVEVLGAMPWSSNGAFLVDVRSGDDHAPAVYKPESGERPLWDFPDGLWRREVASYDLSAAMGFDLVPPTVTRLDGPAGPGSVQAFVPAQFEHHYFTLRDDPVHSDALRRLCAFDLVANSTDRKGGHVLVDGEGRVWAIDNGLTFHVEFKVRTVLWDFAGEPLPDEVATALGALLGSGLPSSFDGLLDRDERDATLHRARALLSTGQFPHDHTGRRYPWPLV